MTEMEQMKDFLLTASIAAVARRRLRQTRPPPQLKRRDVCAYWQKMSDRLGTAEARPVRAVVGFLPPR